MLLQAIPASGFARALPASGQGFFPVSSAASEAVAVNRIIRYIGGYEEKYICILAFEEGRGLGNWGRFPGMIVAPVADV
jgi:hypothetical protein